MKILVTGGAGFLGSELVASLAKTRSNQVCIFDSFSHGTAINRKLPKRKNVLSPVNGNIRNYYDIHRTVAREKPDVVFHLASYVTRPETVDNFRLCAEVNHIGTANLLDACLSSGKKPSRIIFASCESARDPISHLGVSKKAAEDLLHTTAPLAGIKTVTLRFSEMYGLSKSPTSKSMISFLIDHMLTGYDIALYNVNKVRDFVHVSDAVKACQLALDTEGLDNIKLDIGTGKGLSIKDLTHKIRKATGHQGQLKFLESDFIKIQDSVADPNPAKKILGFRCEKNFDEELPLIVKKRKRDLK